MTCCKVNFLTHCCLYWIFLMRRVSRLNCVIDLLSEKLLNTFRNNENELLSRKWRTVRVIKCCEKVSNIPYSFPIQYVWLLLPFSIIFHFVIMYSLFVSCPICHDEWKENIYFFILMRIEMPIFFDVVCRDISNW